MLFGDNFGSLANERLEAAAALTKPLGMDKPRSDFHKGHSQKTEGSWGWLPIQRPLQAEGMATQ